MLFSMAPSSVIRSSRSLVTPCQPTPSGLLDLSVLDKLPVVRSYSHTLHVFRHGPEAPKVIKEGLSKALVPYYPLAGRLKESSHSLGQLLQIDCSGQGVWFVEAYAGYSLDNVDYFDNADSIPYHDLLPDKVPYKVEGIEPLVQMQVTQFACGGFVMGLVFSHTVCDGLEAAQFMIAVGELARGSAQPGVEPVWQRDVTDDFKAAIVAKMPPSFSNGFLHHVSIDISMDEIKQLKQEFHDLTGKTCSTFVLSKAKKRHDFGFNCIQIL